MIDIHINDQNEPVEQAVFQLEHWPYWQIYIEVTEDTLQNMLEHLANVWPVE